MNIVLGYDKNTGQVFDKNNTMICTWTGLEDHEQQETGIFDELHKLKKAGFTAEDIVLFRAKGII